MYVYNVAKKEKMPMLHVWDRTSTYGYGYEDS